MKKCIVLLIAIILIFTSYYLIKNNTNTARLIKKESERNTQTVTTEEIIEQAELLFKGYYYEEALELLNQDKSLINAETKELENKIKLEKDNLVLYEDTVKHIFFHSLILYPEYLFTEDNTRIQ